MRLLETLLVVFAAIYVAQLLVVSLVLAALILFLWCLYQRPKEALALGAGALLVAFTSKPSGLALILALALGFGLWKLCCWVRTRLARRTPPAGLLPRP